MTSSQHQLIKYTSWLTLGAIGGMFLLTASLYLYLSPKLPTVESLKEVKLQTPLRIYSQDSKLIGEFGEKQRTPIDFEYIPPLFIDALLAAEDDGFYSHGGVDFKGLLRAASQLITSGHIRSGGSTITMQVARNFFLTRRQTFTRKFNEILLALRIEEELSKEEILTLYANKIYLGNRAYGIEAAARVYYAKSINELDLAQLAMIAGLPKAPSAYNPLANPERALIRRNWIIWRMLALDLIDEETAVAARAQPITANYNGYKAELDAPYIAEMARREILALLGPEAYTGGYRVYTTVDSRLQAAAQSALQAGVIAYDTRHGYRGAEANIADPEFWLATLKQKSTFSNLAPAIVTEVEEQSLTILLDKDTYATILWENGLKGLRSFISPNRRSGPIKAATDIFRVGDLVRVSVAAEGQIRLAQLPRAQAAIVALNPDNGSIQALAGGFNFRQSHFNRITQAERQPGSNFKPFIYTAALESGFTAASMINDAPVVFEDSQLESYWRPENDSGKFYGPTRLRKALYLSRNLISIRVLRSLGVKNAISGMHRFSFNESALPRDLSLALGSHAVTPLQVATGYAVLANGGYRVEPFLINRIELNKEIVFEAMPLTVCSECEAGDKQDDNTESLEPDATPDNSVNPPFSEESSQLALDDLATELGLDEPEEKAEESVSLPVAPRVVEPRVAYIIDSILKDVIKKGTGRKALSLKRSDIGGKTGTTNGPRDAWFSGYSPHIVATAWFGFDDNQLLGRNEYGGSAALPIWMQFMRTALKGKPEIIRPQPEGMVMVRIDPVTGQRVGANHPNAIFEIFRKENLPPMSTKTPPRTGNGANDTLPEDLF